tara:strand:- start:1098 stop:1208 length:111 start_codon:yes stop_codon:yes gene_type:complete
MTFEASLLFRELLKCISELMLVLLQVRNAVSPEFNS